ncbi:MAG: protoglobin domain-containing protein [Gemmatales bacterium]
MVPQSIHEKFVSLRRYLDWSKRDDEQVARLRAVIMPFAEVFIEDFYAEIVRYPVIAKVITGGDAQIARLKKSLLTWIDDLFVGKYDADYVARRWQVGFRHVEIGLDQTFVNVAHARLRMQMQCTLMEELKNQQEQLRNAQVTLHKLLDLDLALISDAYAAELDVRQRHQAKQDKRLAAIGQMITGLAHEARNALQRLRASTESLEIELEGQAAYQQDLSRLSVAQDDLTRLFTEVQNYASPIVLEKENIKLHQVVTQAWDSLARERQSRNCELHLNIPSKLNGGYYDSFRLQQIFRNFFENSLAASSDPVRLNVSAGEAMLDDHHAIELIVQDNGPGLSESARTRVFEPFFTTKSKGTGLGMAIASRIVEAHGGRLTLGPAGSSGADFRVILPRVEHDTPTAHRHRG